MASTSEHRASDVATNFEIVKVCEEMNASKSQLGRCYNLKAQLAA
jgi:hypothetical protein